MKAVVQGTLDVAENTLDQGQVLVTGIMHVKTNLLDGVGDVRTCERQVLKSTS